MSPRRRNRESETDGFRKEFESYGWGRSYNEFVKRSRARRALAGGNSIRKLLDRAYEATNDPIFLEACHALEAYGLAEERDPAKRVMSLETLLATAHYAREVDREIRAAKSGPQRAPSRVTKRICERWAAFHHAAPTYAAAHKRIERTLKALRSGAIPDGDTGRSLLVADGHFDFGERRGMNLRGLADLPQGVDLNQVPIALKLQDLQWVPDNREWREKVLLGKALLLAVRWNRDATTWQTSRKSD